MLVYATSEGSFTVLIYVAIFLVFTAVAFYTSVSTGVVV